MFPQALQREPLFDVHPRTGVSFEVFYSDRTMETFGRGGAGWFWWPRRRALSPDGPATGPFATRYAAYRHALQTVSFSVPRSDNCTFRDGRQREAP
jgi:hypothetical protein